MPEQPAKAMPQASRAIVGFIVVLSVSCSAAAWAGELLRQESGYGIGGRQR
jgi:hypothetical protein